MEAIIYILIAISVVLGVQTIIRDVRKRRESNKNIALARENEDNEVREYKVCPMCGYLLVSFENRYSDEICRFCGTPIEYIPEEYNMLPWQDAEHKYCQDYIILDPKKREAYKNRMEIEEIESEMRRKEWAREAAMQANVPKCPTCGSTNVEKLTSLDRGVSVSVLGPFSNKINKSFKCRNCKYTW